jgi:hypothetical protein
MSPGFGRGSCASALGKVTAVKGFRRAVVAVLIAAVAAAFVRLRGSGGTPPSSGGWREVPADELQ